MNKLKDDQQYRSLFNQNVSDHMNTYTHRKLAQGENGFKAVSNNGTPISVSFNSQNQFASHK